MTQHILDDGVKIDMCVRFAELESTLLHMLVKHILEFLLRNAVFFRHDDIRIAVLVELIAFGLRAFNSTHLHLLSQRIFLEFLVGLVLEPTRVFIQLWRDCASFGLSSSTRSLGLWATVRTLVFEIFASVLVPFDSLLQCFVFTFSVSL